MPPLLSQILLDLLIYVRPAIERDDTRVVDHLVADDYFIRGLHDPVAVAIDDGKHRSHHTSCDAPIVVGEVQRAFERATTKGSAIARRPPGLCLRRQRRHLPVAIHNQRRLVERLLQPCVVVAECAAAVVRALPRLLVAFQLVREFSVGQLDSARELVRAGQRNADGPVTGPRPLEIWLPPRRLRGCPRSRGRSLCRRRFRGGLGLTRGRACCCHHKREHTRRRQSCKTHGGIP